uniref:Uncharacterized protein n=1 Tax=Proboscia inermis TaxID=420281 RepID=A0A7S0CCE8_9STRA
MDGGFFVGVMVPASNFGWKPSDDPDAGFLVSFTSDVLFVTRVNAALGTAAAAAAGDDPGRRFVKGIPFCFTPLRFSGFLRPFRFGSPNPFRFNAADGFSFVPGLRLFCLVGAVNAAVTRA